MKKNLFSKIGMFALATVLTLSSCGNSSNESSGGSEENKKIVFWAYEGASIEGEKILEDVIADFEAKTNIEVEVLAVPRADFATKLASSIAVGQGPDIAYMDQPDVSRYAADGLLVDYTDKMSDINVDDYYEGAYETNVIDGKLYGLPLNHTTVAIFYNKDLVDGPASTWDEWIADSKKVFEDNNGEVAAFEQMWGGGGGAWLFPAFVHSGGGSMVNEDETAVTFGEQAGVDAVNLILDIYEYSPHEIRTASNAFMNGLVAYKLSGPWEIGAFDEAGLNYGVMKIPSKDGGIQYSNIGGENVVAFKDGQDSDSAWELMKYLTSSDVNSEIVKVTGNYPANKNSDISEYLAHEGYSVFFEQLETAVPRPAKIVNWTKINDDYIGAALDKALVDGEDPATVLKEAQDSANEILELVD